MAPIHDRSSTSPTKKGPYLQYIESLLSEWPHLEILTQYIAYHARRRYLQTRQELSAWPILAAEIFRDQESPTVFHTIDIQSKEDVTNHSFILSGLKKKRRKQTPLSSIRVLLIPDLSPEIMEI